MKNGLKSYLCVASMACIIFSWFALDLYAQDEASALSRQQRVKMANEHYAKGKELNQQGEYAKANDEFKMAQDLLGGQEPIVMEQAAPAEPEKVVEQPVAAAPKKQSRQAEKRKDKASKEPVVPADIQVDADNYFRMAIEFSAKGQSEKAIAAYQEAIKLTPKNPSLYYNSGIECLKLSRFPDAVEMFKKVIGLNPKEKDAYYNLGVLYDSYLGDKDMAKFYYQKYLKFPNKAEDIKEVKGWISQIDKEKKELE
jgi:tetratricopeptide (TPR) repeat protein